MNPRWPLWPPLAPKPRSLLRSLGRTCPVCSRWHHCCPRTFWPHHGPRDTHRSDFDCARKPGPGTRTSFTFSPRKDASRGFKSLPQATPLNVVLVLSPDTLLPLGGRRSRESSMDLQSGKAQNSMNPQGIPSGLARGVLFLVQAWRRSWVGWAFDSRGPSAAGTPAGWPVIPASVLVCRIAMLRGCLLACVPSELLGGPMFSGTSRGVSYRGWACIPGAVRLLNVRAAAFLLQWYAYRYLCQARMGGGIRLGQRC